MGETNERPTWQPICQADRSAALDTVRGVALFGVLLVNLHSDFRVSLASHILAFHTDPGWVNWAADVAITALLEFKAFALFSLLFGAGLAVFAERAAARGAGVTRFLVRRLVVLLALGLGHLLLVWNGDILTLYAICGFLMLPLLRLAAPALVAAGVLAIALPYMIPWGFAWPSEATLRGLAAEADQVYTEGSVGSVLVFHGRETRLLILPLLVGVLPRTLGLMAVGAAVWKAGVIRNPDRHRRLLGAVACGGALLGGTTTALKVYSASTGRTTGVPPALVEAGSSVPLALSYGAALLLALRLPAVVRASRPFAAVGQMALTNYLTQSLALSLLFYGYGLGLYGRLGSAASAGVGFMLYAGQVAFSRVWLRRYRFGPVEWLWRSLTYGQRQPLRRGEAS